MSDNESNNGTKKVEIGKEPALQLGLGKDVLNPPAPPPPEL